MAGEEPIPKREWRNLFHNLDSYFRYEKTTMGQRAMIRGEDPYEEAEYRLYDDSYGAGRLQDYLAYAERGREISAERGDKRRETYYKKLITRMEAYWDADADYPEAQRAFRVAAGTEAPPVQYTVQPVPQIEAGTPPAEADPESITFKFPEK